MNTLHMLHSCDVEVGKHGTTVREGTKWGKVNIGEQVELCCCVKLEHEWFGILRRRKTAHQIVGVGEIVAQWLGPFRSIPARLLEIEHEESSRNYSGLLKSMKRAYGEAFHEDSTVTVLEYKRLS